ncbi:unnamed protein product, partial [Pylaiella littoralis]
QKQQAEVKSKAANEAFRQKRLAQGDQITKAVKTLADSVAARRVLDEEAAVRARETAAESRKQRKVNNMRGQLEFSEVGSAQYYELLAVIMADTSNPCLTSWKPPPQLRQHHLQKPDHLP